MSLAEQPNRILSGVLLLSGWSLALLISAMGFWGGQAQPGDMMYHLTGFLAFVLIVVNGVVWFGLWRGLKEHAR